MKVRLICSENNRAVIGEFLLSNNMIIDDNSSIMIVEDGCDAPDDYAAKIIFHSDKINEFIVAIGMINQKKQIEDIIIGSDNGRYIPLDIENICYFSGQNNDTYAHLDDKRQYLVKSKLYRLEDDLSERHFFRINKSELVNMKKITLITPMFKGKLLINLEGCAAPFDISRGYTKAFKERLGF